MTQNIKQRLCKPVSSFRLHHMYVMTDTMHSDFVFVKCQLCNTDDTEICQYCADDPKNTRITLCPLTLLMCGHSFHFHCLCGHTKYSPRCPTCEQEVEFKAFIHRQHTV